MSAIGLVIISPGVLMRALLFLVAVIMTWAMITSAGVLRNVFVKAGKRSLAIYLLHGFFILPATPWLGVVFDQYGPIVASLICMTATLLVVYILSLSVFDRNLRALGSQSAGMLLSALPDHGKRSPGCTRSRSAEIELVDARQSTDADQHVVNRQSVVH